MNLRLRPATFAIPHRQIAFTALAAGAVVDDVVAEDVAVDAEEAVAGFALVAPAFAEARLGPLFLLMSLRLACAFLVDKRAAIRISSLEYNIAL